MKMDLSETLKWLIMERYIKNCKVVKEIHAKSWKENTTQLERCKI